MVIYIYIYIYIYIVLVEKRKDGQLLTRKKFKKLKI